jgi:Flp pilus assembly CpaE family ATPase
MRPGFRIEPTQIRYLIEFARRNYGVICTDLSGLMERYSVELMQESKHIFLVCTPELASVYLARQKVDFLRTLDLEDRIRVVVNRAHKGAPVSTHEIEQVVGLPVVASFPNDYRGVHRALTEGKPVPRASELGRKFAEMAGRLISGDPTPEPARRFVDYFTLTPVRMVQDRRAS